MKVKGDIFRYLKFVTVFSVASVCSLTTANAQLDPLIEGAKLCTHHLQRYEREYGIPAHLLSAIASTESGRYHEGLKIKLPWPWTINAEGKGYFFNNKAEAMAAVHRLQASGVKSIDVGCMQVNLYHHPNAFSSISQAFEPENNIAYAASFLRNLYQEEGSWKQAASDYHSKTPERGNQYVGLVYNSWFKIIDKLRAARINIPDNSSTLQNLPQQANAQSAQPQPKHIILGQKNQDTSSNYKSPQTKTIKVVSNGITERRNGIRRRENGMIVVHPEIKVTSAGTAAMQPQNLPPEPMVIADASQNQNRQSLLDLAPSAGDSRSQPEAKIIRIDNKLVDRSITKAETSRKSGPNFIFND